jgi:hypothetical protein
MLVKNPLKPKPGDHWIQSRGWEVTVGLALAIIGLTLLWDAFDNRGRKLPWPAGGLAPW